MKKIFSIIIWITLSSLLFVQALAHPGRLDANGGHHDRINGGYHYHNGENAGRTHNYYKEYTTRRTNYTYTYTYTTKETTYTHTTTQTTYKSDSTREESFSFKNFLKDNALAFFSLITMVCVIVIGLTVFFKL